MYKGRIYYDIKETEKDCVLFANQGETDRVYSLIMAITGGDHNTASSVEGWCEIASIGETYEHEKFTVEIVLEEAIA